MAPFNRVTFKSTHNSYSGNIGGTRGSILEQLAKGTRSIELDLHVGDFAKYGDYQIGHNGPGDDVWHQGENPASNSFAEWLAQIATFSRGKSCHAPIQLVLDIKSNLDLPSGGLGNLGALNARLRTAFGTHLVPPSGIREWPDVDALRGRVLIVLSGDSGTRLSYTLDHGANPAVAVNKHGQVVEVHESETGNHTLWYWTGLLQANGSVRWLWHGRYGRGTTPAVTLQDDGWVVEVHKSEGHDRLWYQIGRIDANIDVVWSEGRDYDDGVMPSIRFDQSGALSLREIHRSQAHNQNWDWSVTLDPSEPSLTFIANAPTGDPRWLTMIADPIAVQTVSEDVLVYSSGLIDRAPICYEQLAFVEYQADDLLNDLLREGARFVAADANQEDFLVYARLVGWLARGWDFKHSSPRLTPPENYPATDDPNAVDDWYGNYCAKIGVVS